MRPDRATSPAPSARLDGLPGYGKGRAKGARVAAHRLGSNEAPDTVYPAITRAVTAALSGANRYPDLRGETLAAALAARHGLAAAQIAVSAGSIVLLDQIVRGWCDSGDEIVASWRSYEAYPIIAGLSGAELVQVPLNTDHGVDAAAFLAALTKRSRIALICNPNNPTGTALEPQALDALIAAVPAHILVVLDEAYCDFADDAETVAKSPAALLSRHPNLVILRTFSKAWGLAGLRVGYAMAAPEIIRHIHAVQPPFPLPGVALAAALAALDHEPAVTARIARNATERRRLSEGLRAKGVPVAPSQANFVWLPLGERSAALNAHLAQMDIAARCLDGEGLRITTGTAEDTDAVLDAVASWRPHMGSA
ncbi:histidinol-phosphate transaminase [Pararhodobacter oceanensis]|uniref:histidinol-phosphate transaminase n=1 Tax=Pararhodobacter oceanensis TaxID=2172121 RepID=UPI003A8DDF77